MSYNKILAIGNLGRDPVLRYTPQGDAVADFSIATSEKRGGQEHTIWFKVTVWRKTAEACNEYLHKGSKVYVEGRLGQEEYTDREGNKRTNLVINATEVQFLSSRQGNDQGSYQGGSARNEARAALATPSGQQIPDDDIPF